MSKETTIQSGGPAATARGGERLEPQVCDLLIRNGYVVSIDAERRVFPSGAVAISGGWIVDVGPEREVAPRFSAKQVIDAHGAPVHPGYVDAHAHVTLHTTRGAFPDSPVEAEYMGFYTRWMNALRDEDEFASTLLACLEMLRNGITCFLEPGTVFEPDTAARAAEQIGIRGSLAEPYLWDRNAGGGHQLDRAPTDTKRALRLVGNQLWRNKDPETLVRGHVGLYGVGTATDELELAAKDCADENGVILTQHQSFHPDDVNDDDRRFGRHPLVHFADLGVLGPNCTFAHMNAIRDDEVGPVVDSSLSVAWNPGNYMNYGIANYFRHRMPELYRQGVGLAFGSDVAKVWGFGEQAILGYLLARQREDFLSAEQIMEISTRGGARAIGLQERIGSLELGKRADVVIRRSGIPEDRPANDVIRNLALVDRSKSVDRVIVDGKLVIESGRATLVDDEEIFDRAEASARRIAKRAGLDPGAAWPIVG